MIFSNIFRKTLFILFLGLGISFLGFYQFGLTSYTFILSLLIFTSLFGFSYRKDVQSIRSMIRCAKQSDWNEEKVFSSSSNEVGQLVRSTNDFLKRMANRIKTLEESESRLKATIEHMNEGVIAIHSDSTIASYNQKFLDLFGSSYPIQQSTKFTDAIRNSQLIDLFDRALESKKTQKKVMDFATNGKRNTFEVQAVYIPIRDDKMVAFVFYDLTDIRESEKMKRDFITNASHQLKTPLTAIQGYAETLIEDEEIDSKIRKDFLTKIKLKSVEAADLVVKLIQLSKLESDFKKIHLTTVHVVKTIQELERKFEGNLKKYQIELVHEFDVPDLEIQTDISLFHLILENLLENAIKYSKSNGKVFVSTEKINHDVEIKIRDEGIGIPVDDQSRIFERFFRSHNAETHTNDGVGIGMAMVKSALEKIQGSISVDSRQNQGTVMSLRFPRELE